MLSNGTTMKNSKQELLKLFVRKRIIEEKIKTLKGIEENSCLMEITPYLIFKVDKLKKLTELKKELHEFEMEIIKKLEETGNVKCKYIFDTDLNKYK